MYFLFETLDILPVKGVTLDSKKTHIEKRKTLSTKETGNIGEKKAAEYLVNAGYSIVERNWRTKRGEIDIIAIMKNVLVFAEVKTLAHNNIETLGIILGKIKQEKIVETAKCFLQVNRQYKEYYIRFDVLVVDMPGFPSVYHIEDAFSESV